MADVFFVSNIYLLIFSTYCKRNKMPWKLDNLTSKELSTSFILSKKKL